MNGLFIVLVVLALPFLIYFKQSRIASFEEELANEVRARGGTVLSSERPWFSSGPWFFRGKGKTIVKMVYRDAAGEVRQVWGRTGTFGNDVDWDYSDGDNNIG